MAKCIITYDVDKNLPIYHLIVKGPKGRTFKCTHTIASVIRMFGWRAKIGLIVPHPDVVTEPLFYSVLPEGVSVHTARMILETLTIEGLLKMSKKAAETACRLPTEWLDLIIFHCTTGSLIGGLDWDKKIIKKIESKVGVPTITTSTAVIKALKELGLRKLAVATPYIEEVNQREREFLERNGFEITKIKGLGIKKAGGMIEVEPEKVYQFARSVDTPDSDGLFVSCTAFRIMENLSKLEKELGKPVVSSPSATIWLALKRLNIIESIKGYGSLLEIH